MMKSFVSRGARILRAADGIMPVAGESVIGNGAQDACLARDKDILRVENLSVHYPVRRTLFGKTPEPLRAVDDVSFSVKRGTTLGIVGESGSGKTTTGRAIMRLAPVAGGRIFFEKTELTALAPAEFFPFRKRVQMIFQDPYNSLNPRMRVAGIIGEALEIHFPEMSAGDRESRIAELLRRVGLQPEHMCRFPHEFSGGQRQRIGIARALAVEPELLVCDEPVSALDVSVQAQIVNLLQDLQDELGLTYIFIGHDLAVVEHISDYVVVMARGKIVEQGAPDALYANPQEEYTRKLLAAVPVF